MKSFKQFVISESDWSGSVFPDANENFKDAGSYLKQKGFVKANRPSVGSNLFYNAKNDYYIYINKGFFYAIADLEVINPTAFGEHFKNTFENGRGKVKDLTNYLPVRDNKRPTGTLKPLVAVHVYSDDKYDPKNGVEAIPSVYARKINSKILNVMTGWEALDNNSGRFSTNTKISEKGIDHLKKALGVTSLDLISKHDKTYVYGFVE